jgi:hypothetical protein
MSFIPGKPIVPGQSESSGQPVVQRLLVGDEGAPTSVTSLVVMVIHEDEGVVRVGHPPSWVIDSLQVAKVPLPFSDLLAVTELRHAAQAVVFVHL